MNAVVRAGIRIVVVENDALLAESLFKTLRNAGDVVDLAESGTEADHLLCTKNYDLVILDLGLPGIGGLEVLSRLRQRKANTPVLILSALELVLSAIGDYELALIPATAAYDGALMDTALALDKLVQGRNEVPVLDLSPEADIALRVDQYDRQNQILPHWNKWLRRQSEEKPKIACLKWEVIDGACRSISHERCSEPDRFLLMSLAEFLAGEGLGKLLPEHARFAATLEPNNDADRFLHARLPLVRLARALNAGPEVWELGTAIRHPSEVYIARKDWPIPNVSVNLSFSETKLVLTVFAFNMEGYKSLLSRLENGRMKEMEMQLVDASIGAMSSVKVRPWIAHKNGSPLNRPPLQYEPVQVGTEIPPNTTRRAVEEKLAEMKLQYKGRVAPRLSICAFYGENFYALPDFGSQLRQIKSDVEIVGSIFS